MIVSDKRTHIEGGGKMSKQIESTLQDYETPTETDYEINCSICNGIGVYLGTLGRFRWYRCRDCGIEFNILAD